MKLFASSLLILSVSSSAWAGRCDSTVKFIASDLWDMPSSPTSMNKNSSSYGHAKNASIEKLLNRDKAFKISWTFDRKSYEKQQANTGFRPEKKDFQKEWKIRNVNDGVAESWTPSSSWIHPKDESRTDALYGVRADVSDSDHGTLIVKRGYTVKDEGVVDSRQSYKTLKQTDDVRIALDQNCKLASIEYLRPKAVKVTAAQCAWIRDYKIKDLGKNVANELQPIIAKMFPTDDYTRQRIMASCRSKFGVNTPSLAKLLPEKIRATASQPSTAGSASKAQ